MRTFHTGGVATTKLTENNIKAAHGGTIELRDCAEAPVKDEEGVDCLAALKRNGEIAVLDPKGRELEKYKVPYGSWIMVKPGEHTKKGQLLVKGDPHRTPILAEKGGSPLRRHRDRRTVRRGRQSPGGQQLVVIEHKGEMHPQIVEDAGGKILDFHFLPAKASR